MSDLVDDDDSDDEPPVEPFDDVPDDDPDVPKAPVALSRAVSAADGPWTSLPNPTNPSAVTAAPPAHPKKLRRVA